MARSTDTVTGKESSMLVSVCRADVMSGVVVEDLFLCPLSASDFLGDLGEGSWSGTSASSSKRSSSWLSESMWVSSAGGKPASSVICTLRAAPCKSAAERMKSGYTPVKTEINTLESRFKQSTGENQGFSLHTTKRLFLL